MVNRTKGTDSYLVAAKEAVLGSGKRNPQDQTKDAPNPAYKDGTGPGLSKDYSK